jgi:hypothetical protein
VSLYTVTKIKNLTSNMEMNEKKLRGRPVSVYTPSDLVIKAIENKKEITVGDIGEENIWEHQERFIAKKGYKIEFRNDYGEWWRTSAVQEVVVLGGGKFEVKTSNSIYLIEEVKYS